MWTEIKQIVSNQYPDLNPRSEDFYKLAIGAFIIESGAETREELLNNLYEENVVSRQGIKNYLDSSLADSLSLDKTAAGKPKKTKPQSAFRRGFGQAFSDGAIGTLGSIAVAGGLYGLGHLGRRLYNNMTRKSRLKEIQKFHPEVKDMDPALVEETLRTIEKFSPQASDAPLVSGSVIKGVDLNRGEFDPEKAKTLADIKDRSEDILHNMMDSGNTAFVEFGKGYRSSDPKPKKDWVTKRMFTRARSSDLAREKAVMKQMNKNLNKILKPSKNTFTKNKP